MKTTSVAQPIHSIVDSTNFLATDQLMERVVTSFKKIAPYWPLKNLVAVNPLQGFEELPIEEALSLGSTFFQRATIPEPIAAINQQTLKWMSVYADDGQATLHMPLRHLGLFAAWRKLALYDDDLHGQDALKLQWLTSLPENAIQALLESLHQLGIAPGDHELFLTLMLTTLPGWASYIRYRTDWAGLDTNHPHRITQVEYLTLRVIITHLLWPEAKALLAWHRQELKKNHSTPHILDQLQQAERRFRLPLLEQLASQPLTEPPPAEAQFVFCIDIRSESFRRALEATGPYQTLGFAGFFGLPIQLTDTITGESYASCPVLLSPNHTVYETPCGNSDQQEQFLRGYKRRSKLKQLYQSLKYTFTTPFALVESLGLVSGSWMGLCSLAPATASRLQHQFNEWLPKPRAVSSSWEIIPWADQCRYAEGALRSMGLTEKFAPLVILCGHGSSTQNNAYASALDCGACGGRHGGGNARVLTGILNDGAIRTYLGQQGIRIPPATQFIAAEHNTTTDEVTLSGDIPAQIRQLLNKNLTKAKQINASHRFKQLQPKSSTDNQVHQVWLRSVDWAQVRPEWGLARNAAFIVAPRVLTQSLDLGGRCFLHSYDYTNDAQGSVLSMILTAPMVVAQWINSQYLFSTLDNVAYGGGSKITQNITGKIGIIQGNASDLMTGFPLQSVYATDELAYHEPQRLMTVVYAPRPRLTAIIRAQPILQKLFGNGWVQLACLDPETGQPYILTREFEWQGLQ
ncbi:putative inorganic carbon transporter subunit DabA [Spirosoma sp. SC4-14]|uniref:putative inorganic carbon transporter subunit DabA n=1 Tax=Spirosoma sp. SC4-14 TaxID=3128900 RepID=UPI0030CE2AFA